MREDTLPERIKAVPLRLKLLLGCLAVLALAGFGTWLVWRWVPVDAPLPPVLLFAALGLGGLTVFHLTLVPRALEPIRDLERAARAIRSGAREVEIEVSPFSDPELRRVVEVFNETVRETSDLRSRLHTLAMRALDAGEEQLRDLSIRLHDDIAQRFAGLVVRLRIAERLEDPEERRRMLREVRDEARAAVEEVRRLARGLRTPELDDLGLGPALRAFGRSLAERNDLEITFDLTAPNGGLTPRQTIGIYRILQEAMRNTVRHAGASRIDLRLRHRNGRVLAEAADDGRGFDPERIEAGEAPCLGLLAMRERARHIGGTLSLSSRPGEGAVVRVEVPEGPPGSAPNR